MSAKCQWCHRKRPEIALEVDGRTMNVCTNCKTIIQDQELHHDEATERNRREGLPVAE